MDTNRAVRYTEIGALWRTGMPSDARIEGIAQIASAEGEPASRRLAIGLLAQTRGGNPLVIRTLTRLRADTNQAIRDFAAMVANKYDARLPETGK